MWQVQTEDNKNTAVILRTFVGTVAKDNNIDLN
jgi:hypothetical protein